LTGLSQHHLSVPNPFLHIIDGYQHFPALPGVFKKAGYNTLGVQAVSGHEFRRKTYSPIIDFDEFVALETDYPREDWETIHHLLADNYLIDKITYHWPKEDKPVFGLFFSNSTHASYTSWDRKPEFEVLNTTCSEKTKDVLERYATAINQADNAIARLINHFEQQSRKTVIFFFGDHLPGISSVFEDLGLFKAGKSSQRFHTPLRIWSNFDIPTRDRIVSSNLLSALLFDLLQTEIADLPLQLRLVVELYKKVDVFSSYIRDKEGNYYNRQKPPEFLHELAEEYDQVQYDLLEGEHHVMRYFN
jgi:arylsulfatase A-like enzyme